MRKILFPLLIIAALLAACQGSQLSSQDAARTAAAATLNAELEIAAAELDLATAQAEQTALAGDIQALETENALLNAGGTETVAAQATLGAINPQLVPPEAVACRFGPNVGFSKVADLSAGEAVDVLARSSTGDWWQVPSPEDPQESCWVFWQQDLEFLGEVFNLPLVQGPQLPPNTAAPTSPPGFSLRYVGNNTCGGTRYAVLRVINTGPDTYRSARVMLSDSSGEVSSADGNHEFLPTSSSCPKGNPDLLPGQEAFVAVPIKGVGGTLGVRVILCTGKGYSGTCLARGLEFQD
jgi:hypothetical protein